MKRFSTLLIVVLAVTLFGCEGSVTAPPPPPPPPSPAVQSTSPTGVLSGVVRDAGTSQAIAGVNVIWAGLAEGWGDRGHGVMTGADGRYRLMIRNLGGPGSATGTIAVQASKTGYAPQVVTVSVIGEVTQDFQLVPTGPAAK